MILTKDPVEFVMHYATYKDKEELRERIQKHIEYKTCFILFDETDYVCAVCLWNISSDGKIAEVSDMIIREDTRGTDIMRRMLGNTRKIWPLEYLKYNRDYNEDGHDRWDKPKMFKVESFLRRKV